MFKSAPKRLLDLTALILAFSMLTGCTSETDEQSTSRIPAGIYTVSEGDNLSTISVRAYGRMDVWYSLLNANPQLCKRAGFDLVDGETIEIPAKENIDMSLPKSIFPETLPSNYVIMPGDSLHFIALRCYGDRDLWPLIYDANRDILSERVKKDTRQLQAGQEILIPELPVDL